MLKIERTVLPSPEQWDIIIEGMRNPMNSWDKSDSCIEHIENPETMNTADFSFHLGDADHKLMQNLAKAGSVHAKYRRMIPVYLTINAPLYWWKEMDRYRVGVEMNSCSTMHKIHAKEFTADDFSHENLTDVSMDVLWDTIDTLNTCRGLFLVDKNKEWWWQMIQLLPTSYNQRRTVMLNYEVLVGIYRDRKDHKLDEWHTFCRWIEGLPYSELITGKE